MIVYHHPSMLKWHSVPSDIASAFAHRDPGHPSVKCKTDRRGL